MGIFFFAASDFFGIFIALCTIGVVFGLSFLLARDDSTEDYAKEVGINMKEDQKSTSVEDQQTPASPVAKSRPATLFIPFVRGVSASMSEQFVDHGGRTGSSSAAGIANDLTATVIKYEAEGYEFQKFETVHVDVSPGCIGMLMGKGKEYHPYDYLVFSKSLQKIFNHPV